MIPEVIFEWDGTGSVSVLAEHAHVHHNGACVKNRNEVWCNAPRRITVGAHQTDPVDHAAIARDTVVDLGFPFDTGHLIATAQVHATLALLEAQVKANELAERIAAQHRIANILALVGDEDPETVDDNLREFGLDPVAVRADIRAAMGWS